MDFNFKENYKTKVEDLGIKKIKSGKFDYLSWSHCQKVMKELDPDSHYTMKFNETTQSFIWGGFVRVEMSFNGEIHEHAYPVLDNNNNGIMLVNNEWHFVTKPTKANPEPIIKQAVTSFDVNNAQMRGFAKVFSMVTGIGLSIFTGEDVEQYISLEKHGEIKDKETQLLEARKDFNRFFKRFADELTPKLDDILGGLDPKKFTEVEQWQGILDNAKKCMEQIKEEKQESNKDETKQKFSLMFGENNAN